MRSVGEFLEFGKDKSRTSDYFRRNNCEISATIGNLDRHRNILFVFVNLFHPKLFKFLTIEYAKRNERVIAEV